jgi:hypothetical protein
MLFICATFGFFADLNLCSALNQIAPKTLSSSSDILFAVCAVIDCSLATLTALCHRLSMTLTLFLWNSSAGTAMASLIEISSFLS